MSRALARLRETTGDPLLVRAGQGLFPTPRAVEIRERVSHVVEEGQAVLRPAEKLDLKRLVRTFTLRTSEEFVENFWPDLIALIREEAPGVRLHFLLDRLIGVVRTGHSLAKGRITPSRYSGGQHISVSWQGQGKGPIEEALQRLGLERDVVTIVGGFATAIALGSGLILSNKR